MEAKKIILTFPTHLIEQPITYNLIKDYQIMVNILKAKVVPREEGRLVIEMKGECEAIERGERYLAGLGIEVEPLAQRVNYIEDKCVHCTACIP
ncbi:MAG: NIL domain-containing protein, partial [Thermodesulfobacteriota bacterium]|nr:NIL domain-containing protein [Thermodesulfobacteriota bacterium]